MQQDSRLNFTDEEDIKALWQLVNGDIDPEQFKSQHPSVYSQIEKTASLTGGVSNP